MKNRIATSMTVEIIFAAWFKAANPLCPLKPAAVQAPSWWR
jgi:hypothetical protein